MKKSRNLFLVVKTWMMKFAGCPGQFSRLCILWTTRKKIQKLQVLKMKRMMWMSCVKGDLGGFLLPRQEVRILKLKNEVALTSIVSSEK